MGCCGVAKEGGDDKRGGWRGVDWIFGWVLKRGLGGGRWDEGHWSEFGPRSFVSFASVFDLVCLLRFGFLQGFGEVGMWREVKSLKYGMRKRLSHQVICVCFYFLALVALVNS